MWNSGCVGDFKPRCQTPQRILVSKNIQKERGTSRNKVPRCAHLDMSTRVNPCQLVSRHLPTWRSEIIRDHLRSFQGSNVVSASHGSITASWLQLPGTSTILAHGETWRNRFQVIVELMYDHVIFSLFQDERLNSACQIHPSATSHKYADQQHFATPGISWYKDREPSFWRQEF